MGAFRKTKFFGLALLLVVAMAAPSRGSEDKNCTECHPEFTDELAGKHNHEPFEKDDCKACHPGMH